MPTVALYCSYALIFLMFSCSSKHEINTVDYAPLADFNGKIIEVSKTITVAEGATFDGNNNLYQWVGEGDCSQQEGMPAMFNLLKGSTLKNIWIENAPDGVHVKGANVTIDGMINIDVCEDAISISKSKTHPDRDNIKITNSKFYYCEDKAIQLTRGNNIYIEHNEFYGCAKAIRIKQAATNIYFNHNNVIDANHAIKVTGGNGVASNNNFNGAKSAIWVEKNGLFTDGGGNTFNNIHHIYLETDGGKIIH